MAFKFKNSETIIGRVYQHSLTMKKVANENSANYGGDYIRGKLDIAVDEEGLNVITVNYTYVAPVFKNGKKNETFNVLKKIMEAGRTWVADGKDAAMMVKATPSLALNEFDTERGGEEVHVAAKKNEGGFIEIINALPPVEERTDFTVDTLITNVKRVEANEEKGYPEYVNIHGAIFDFKGALLPIDLVSKNPAAMDFFESLGASSKNPYFIKLKGIIDCTVVQKKIVEESAFGEAAVTTVPVGRKEWIVNWAAKEPYDYGDEEVLTDAQVKQKMQDREVYLAEQKKNREEYLKKRATSEDSAFSTSNETIQSDDFNF